MPQVSADNNRAEVPAGKRLVLAIEQDLGVNILHRCGGYAGCTTCRVEFLTGEPDTMTTAELQRLKAGGLLGKYRLSCQIRCDHDMAVVPAYTVETSDFDEPGDAPQAEITPQPEWIRAPAR